MFEGSSDGLSRRGIPKLGRLILASGQDPLAIWAKSHGHDLIVVLW